MESFTIAANYTMNQTISNETEGSGSSSGSGIGLSHFDSMSLMAQFDYYIMLFILIFAFVSNGISIHTFSVSKTVVSLHYGRKWEKKQTK